jgi:hypothetical protein
MLDLDAGPREVSPLDTLALHTAQHQLARGITTFGDAYNKVDTTSSAVPTWVRRYFYLHTVVGYVLAAFLLAALSQLTSVQ